MNRPRSALLKSRHAAFAPDAHGQVSPVVVRPSTLDDAHAIVELLSFFTGEAAEAMAPGVRLELEAIGAGDEERYSCVGPVDGAIVGFARCGRLLWSERGEPALPGGWFLTGACVHPTAQRRGLGAALTAHRLAWLESQTGVVHYFAVRDNQASRALHVRTSFVEVARDLVLPMVDPVTRHVLYRTSLSVGSSAEPRPSSDERGGMDRDLCGQSCRLRDVNRLVVTFIVLLHACLVAPAASADQQVLPPHAAGPVRALLNLDEPLQVPDGETYQLSASIEQDRVVVRAGHTGGPVVLSVTLLHPDAAPAGSEAVGQVALLRTPGPAPEALLAPIVARMKASGVSLPWVRVEAPPDEEAEREYVKPLELTAIDFWLEVRDTARARLALAGIAAPDAPLERAALALRWRLAGDPARAEALIAGRSAELEPHLVLALRLARGEPMTVAAIVAAVPERGSCRAVRLAKLLLVDRAYEAALQLTDAIRARDPSCVEAFHQGIVVRELYGRREDAQDLLSEAKPRFHGAIEMLAAESFLRRRSGDLHAAWLLEVRLGIRRLLSDGAPDLAREMVGWLGRRLLHAVAWVGPAVVTWHAEATSSDAPNWVWCPTVGALPCLRYVSGGTYHMGAQTTHPDAPAHDPDASPDEAPVHSVTISALYAMRTEVDVRAYTLCVKAGVCRLEDVLTVGGYFNYGQPHRAGHPINGVSWFGAQRFCGWLGGRLPTEAEWEFLARGTDQRRFPWGDAPAGCADDRSARFHEGCPSDGTRPPGIHTVASAAGLAAMGGGVWEWVSDWYGAYSSMPLHDPTGPPNGAKRVQRGGAWSSDDPLERRASHRASMPPDSRLSDVGFRCVRDVR